jgi:hypothetical protein
MALGLALAAAMVVTSNALGYDDQGFDAAQAARAEVDAQADDKVAGAGGALATLNSGSDYAAPEIMQLGYGPGGPPAAVIHTFAGFPDSPAVGCDAGDGTWQFRCE